MRRNPARSDHSRAPGGAGAAPFEVACLLALILGGTLAWPSGGLAQQGQVPLEEVERFTDGDDDRGGELYQRYCRGCHGEEGRGGGHTFMPHVENLTRKDYIEQVPDGYLYMVIAEGGAAAGLNSYMPAWRSTLSEQDIKDVIAYIRSLPTY